MKKLLIFSAFFLAGATAFAQCVPPTANPNDTATKHTANWPSSLTYNPLKPVDPAAVFSCANYANSPLPKRTCSDAAKTACYGDLECTGKVDATTPTAPAICNGTPAPNTGIRKFVDPMPTIPIAVADQTTFVGSDYYEIELVEYTTQMHTDLPATKVRGYRQANGNGGAGYPAQYLGPIIVAQKNRPVRIKFTNKLPIGSGGNLFLPVDTTLMGAGITPTAPATEPDPQNPACGKPGPKPSTCYTENRATLHLHGGLTPWISDGTPHQWITPASETTAYPQGVQVSNVPDMNMCNSPTDGCQTFYYTNQQSARLLFYHDHAAGLTRLNVYAGEASGYLIQDDVEKALVTKLATLGTPIDPVGIPLVIQDKTFVPAADQLAVEDPLWDQTRWGTKGNLWFPHVYSPAENPDDRSGVNAFGRWVYGPWFYPPTDITYPPIANPYYDSNCNADVTGWCEPPVMPATPNLSVGAEAFNDTPVVNGKAYPYLNVNPQKYRFRVLNAANDRSFNLQLYVADSTSPAWTPGYPTEVALDPAAVLAAQTDPTVVPNPNELLSPRGPAWIQIGTEGGFLPAPVVVPNQHITWVMDPTLFNVGNVENHSLLLAPAERADVIVDFTKFAGKTLILYNDAPAAFPARVANFDYYLGHPDSTDTGGAPPTLPGYGPNTRTIMQIRVSGSGGVATPDDYDTTLFANLQTEFAHHLVNGKPAGVFETGQHPIIVGQQAYNSAYGTAFRGSGLGKDGFVRIYDNSLTFDTLSGNSLNMSLERKALHDEMGGAFDPEYGRMMTSLGMEMRNPNAFTAQFILMGYTDPPTEVWDATNMLKDFDLQTNSEIKVTPISTTTDGTQIWRMTHNGVDTHPIHFHLYDVQVLNRVGWDGFIRQPDATELGWKDTVRVSPLEDTIVAIRPVMPALPWEIPNSVRMLNPYMPNDALLANGVGFQPAAPNGEPIVINNHLVNYGWEYVWHCHILAHEEADMMRPVAVAVPPKAPTGLTLTSITNGVRLNWVDSSIAETGYIVERAEDVDFTIAKTTLPVNGPLPQNAQTYDDVTLQNNKSYWFRVVAINTVGDTFDYSLGTGNGARFPTVTANSLPSNVVNRFVALPNAPVLTSVTVAPTPTVTLNWTYTQGIPAATAFNIMRAPAGSPTFVQVKQVAFGTLTTTDTTAVAGQLYNYRVDAVSGTLLKGSNVVGVVVPLTAPINVRETTALKTTTSLTITWNSVTGATGYKVTRCTNSLMTVGCVTANVLTPLYRGVGLITGTTYYFQVQATNATPAAISAVAPTPAFGATTR